MAMRSSVANKDHFTTRSPCDEHAPKMIWRYAPEPRELLRWIQTRIDLLFTMSENPRTFIEEGRRIQVSRTLTIQSALSVSAIKQARVMVADQPSGGARRDRTDDLMLAKHALSQLSYGPVTRRRMLRSIKWWAWEDLNFRPHAYQARALTN